MSNLMPQPGTPLSSGSAPKPLPKGVPTAEQEALQEPTIDPIFTLAGGLTGAAGEKILTKEMIRELEEEGITSNLLKDWYNIKVHPKNIEAFKNVAGQSKYQLKDMIDEHIANRVAYLKSQQTLSNYLKQIFKSVPSTASSQYLSSRIHPENKTVSNVSGAAQVPNPKDTKQLFEMLKDIFYTGRGY